MRYLGNLKSNLLYFHYRGAPTTIMLYWKTKLQCNGTSKWKLPQWHGLIFQVFLGSLNLDGYYGLRAVFATWDRGNVAAILQMTCSNWYSCMGIAVYLLEFHWTKLLQMDQLAIPQNWCRQWLGLNKCQGTISTDGELSYWRIYVSLGIGDLTNWSMSYTDESWLEPHIQTYLLISNSKSRIKYDISIFFSMFPLRLKWYIE